MILKSNNNPIGVFDSGIGGTSIWKEIKRLLPKENTIYLSDSLNAPYGQKSKQEIIDLSVKNTEFLLAQGCKIIVVACNTATTNAISYLRNTYNVPIIGIEPAIKAASIRTISNVVGVLATKGTLNSTLFERTSSSIDAKITIIEQIGKGLVELIETGNVDSIEMNMLLNRYLLPMLEKKVDCLVLGCTHYPYLIPNIKKIVGNKIQIIDSGEAVARQTKNILEQNNLLSTVAFNSKDIFYTNTDSTVLSLVMNDYPNVVISKIDF